MKFSQRHRLVAVAVAAALALTGCSQNEGDNASGAVSSSKATSTAAKSSTAASTPSSSTKKASLADWNGKYASLAAFVDDPAFGGEFTEAAQKHGADLEPTKAKLKQRYGVPFEGLNVDGDTLTFVKSKSSLDAPNEKPVKYTFDEAYVQQYKGHELKWSIFKATDGGEYSYVFLMPMHGEETLQHFHARFGKDKEAMKKEETFPTFVDPKIATKEQIVDELMEHAH
ncbi:ZinT/AdcA family metal-binding protein [Staphylococcus chromogenes]|nr:ZinT/AdcA family metal-binding protein [Staphylococcus chromogenes]